MMMVNTVTATIVSHVRPFHTRPFAWPRITWRSLAINTMHTSRMGSITPLMTCETIMMPNRLTLGTMMMTAESMVMAVMMPR